MKIGIIVASNKERKPFFEVFGSPDMHHVGLNAYEVSMWRINSEKFIYLILSGIGEIAAASSTQYLIDNFNVDKIINYGVAGGLSEHQPALKIGIVEKVVHYGFDATFGSDYKVGEYPKKGFTILHFYLPYLIQLLKICQDLSAHRPILWLVAGSQNENYSENLAPISVKWKRRVLFSPVIAIIFHAL